MSYFATSRYESEYPTLAPVKPYEYTNLFGPLCVDFLPLSALRQPIERRKRGKRGGRKRNTSRQY